MAAGSELGGDRSAERTGGGGRRKMLLWIDAGACGVWESEVDEEPGGRRVDDGVTE